jgi:hypothetical protein
MTDLGRTNRSRSKDAVTLRKYLGMHSGVHEALAVEKDCGMKFGASFDAKPENCSCGLKAPP